MLVDACAHFLIMLHIIGHDLDCAFSKACELSNGELCWGFFI